MNFGCAQKKRRSGWSAGLLFAGFRFKSHAYHKLTTIRGRADLTPPLSGNI